MNLNQCITDHQIHWFAHLLPDPGPLMAFFRTACHATEVRCTLGSETQRFLMVYQHGKN